MLSNRRIKDLNRIFSRSLTQYAKYASWDDSNAVHSKLPPLPEELLAKNFTQIVTQNFKKYGDKLAIVCGTSGEKRTYNDLLQNIDKIGHGLQDKFNVQNKDVIACVVGNNVDYFSIVHGCSKIGAAITPLNPIYNEFEVSKQLIDSKSKLLISREENLEVSRKAADIAFQKSGLECKVLSIKNEIGTLINDNSKQAIPLPKAMINAEEDLHLLPYSSGTTGLPKGVMLTHRNLTANLLQLENFESKFMSENDAIISPLPFFHVYGYLVSLHVPLFNGTTVITMKKFEIEKFCQLAEQYKATRVHIVPPIALALAKNPIVDKYDLSSLKIGISGAAPLGKDLEKAVNKRIGLIVKQAWGMSELSPVGTCIPDDAIKSGTVGPPVQDTSVKIKSLQSGEVLPAGEIGALFVKGPQVMKGYLGQQDKTDESLGKDGWFATGDIGFIDEDGYLTITDREKELIKVNGLQVAPAELEALLLTHPEVADSCVIGVPHEKAGEVPKAYVVKKPNSKVTKEEIYAFVQKQVSPHKRLGGGVEFCEFIPKNASGKILRREVAEMDKENTKKLD